MKKDDVIIITCNVCGAMSHAVKTKIPQGYYVKDEFVLCKICFGELR
jgi:ribosomal protein S14